MIAFTMIQKPVKIECKVHAEPWVWATYKGEPMPRIFDFVLDAWRLNHPAGTAEQVTLKFTDLSERDLVLLKDEVCRAIQEALLAKRQGA